IPEMLAQSPDPQSPNPQSLYLVGHETLGRWDGATWAYHLPDALGSVRQAADGAGGVASSREWTPFGVELGGGQAGLGYTGEWWDADVGLLYLRARWYDGQVGRFTRQDPFPGFPKRPQSQNSYPYTTDNPINATDPAGLQQNYPDDDDCEPGEICYTGIIGPYVVPPPPPTPISYADLLADPEKRRRWCAQEAIRSINEAILSGPRDYFDLTWKSIDNSLYSSLCCSESLPAYEEAFLNADPLGREVAGPITVDSGWYDFWASIIKAYGKRLGGPMIGVTTVHFRSRMEVTFMLYEHGTTIDVRDWYDTRSFIWVQPWLGCLSLNRDIEVATKSSERLGPYSLGKVQGAQEGSGNLPYGLRYEGGAGRPERVTMRLLVGMPNAGIPVGVVKEYSIWSPAVSLP
ncbi:MAG: RHS repeat-associated core domain-containing protein, partial [Chloroflexota bacterium]|nr:RHS repeat-associated core domain-containing protein [Chloroflexota bacterium]